MTAIPASISQCAKRLRPIMALLMMIWATALPYVFATRANALTDLPQLPKVPDSVLKRCETEMGERVFHRVKDVEGFILGSGFLLTHPREIGASRFSVYESFHFAYMYLHRSKFSWIELDLSDTDLPQPAFLRVRIELKANRPNCWSGPDPSNYLKGIPTDRCIVVETIPRLTARYRYDYFTQLSEDQYQRTRVTELRVTETASGDLLYKHSYLIWDGKSHDCDRLNPRRSLRGPCTHGCLPYKAHDITDVLVPGIKP